jgi:hypothetical protein
MSRGLGVYSGVFGEVVYPGLVMHPDAPYLAYDPFQYLPFARYIFYI